MLPVLNSQTLKQTSVITNWINVKTRMQETGISDTFYYPRLRRQMMCSLNLLEPKTKHRVDSSLIEIRISLVQERVRDR